MRNQRIPAHGRRSAIMRAGKTMRPPIRAASASRRTGSDTVGDFDEILIRIAKIERAQLSRSAGTIHRAQQDWDTLRLNVSDAGLERQRSYEAEIRRPGDR